MKMRYPTLLIELEAGHPGAANGKRFGVEQHDGDVHTFATLESAQAFMRDHDLVAISPDEMVMLRSIHDQAESGEFGD